MKSCSPLESKDEVVGEGYGFTLEFLATSTECLCHYEEDTSFSNTGLCAEKAKTRGVRGKEIILSTSSMMKLYYDIILWIGDPSA